MKRPLAALMLCAAALAASAATPAPPATPGSEPAVYIYPRSESAADTQYLYDYEMLRQALEATVPTHGPYELKQSAAAMNQARAADEIAAGSGLVNVFARSTSIEHEQRLIPIRIPIDKGLISYRVFLIRADMQPKFDAANTLDDLRQYSVGFLPDLGGHEDPARRRVQGGDGRQLRGTLPHARGQALRLLLAQCGRGLTGVRRAAWAAAGHAGGRQGAAALSDDAVLLCAAERGGGEAGLTGGGGLNRTIKEGAFDAHFWSTRGPSSGRI